MRVSDQFKRDIQFTVSGEGFEIVAVVTMPGDVRIVVLRPNCAGTFRLHRLMMIASVFGVSLSQCYIEEGSPIDGWDLCLEMSAAQFAKVTD